MDVTRCIDQAFYPDTSMKRQRAKAAILIDVTVQISSKALAKAQRPLAAVGRIFSITPDA
jgi:hypothetical protein